MKHARERLRICALSLACALAYLTACGGPDASEGMRRLVDVWIAPPGAGFPLRFSTIDDVSRLGIPLRTDGPAERFRLRVPLAAKFDALLGVSDPRGSAADEPAPVEIEAAICSPSGANEAEPTLARLSFDAVGWHPIAIELEDYAGREIELCVFATAPDALELTLADGRIGTPGARIWPTERPNLVLLVQRKAPGSIGDHASRDALAAEGERYSNAITNSVGAQSTHASLLTGKHPRELMLSDRAGGAFHLGDGELTLAERLHAVGYQTGAFVSSPALDLGSGLAQGFTIHVDRVDEGPAAGESDGDLTNLALHWLDEADRPFFVLLSEAASDTTPDSDARLRRLLAGLEARGAYDESMIAVVSIAPISPKGSEGDADAGPLAGPLRPSPDLEAEIIVKLPRMDDRFPRGKTFAHRVDLLDLHASMLRELGLAAGPEGPTETRSAMRARGIPAHGLRRQRRVHFSEFIGAVESAQAVRDGEPQGNVEAVYRGHFLLLRTDRGEIELIDLEAAGDERTDASEIDPRVAPGLEAELDDWSEGSPPVWESAEDSQSSR